MDSVRPFATNKRPLLELVLRRDPKGVSTPSAAEHQLSTDSKNDCAPIVSNLKINSLEEGF